MPSMLNGVGSFVFFLYPPCLSVVFRFSPFTHLLSSQKTSVVYAHLHTITHATDRVKGNVQNVAYRKRKGNKEAFVCLQKSIVFFFTR